MEGGREAVALGAGWVADGWLEGTRGPTALGAVPRACQNLALGRWQGLVMRPCHIKRLGRGTSTMFEWVDFRGPVEKWSG